MTNIKEARIKAGLSQKEVALTLGVKAPSVWAWENGKSKPTADNLEALAQLYHVSIDYLLGKDEINTNQSMMISRIREARKSKGLTMKALGKIIGCAESTISLYETGQRQPDNETLVRLADALGTTVDFLLGREIAPLPDVADEELSTMIENFRQLYPAEQAEVLSYVVWKLSTHGQ